MRELALCVTAAFAVAGCAVTNTSYPRPSIAAGDPAPSVYTQAPRAALQSELFACNGGSGSNLGELGLRAESLLYTPYIYTPAGALLRNPTEISCLSSGFGWRGAASGGERQHSGLDLANREGGYIYAAGEGSVVFADWRGGYGLVVELDHGRGVRTLYAHLSEVNPNLRLGDHVGAGEPIARMGMTGNATGVHLHYEVNIDGTPVDPLSYGAEPPALF